MAIEKAGRQVLQGEEELLRKFDSLASKGQRAVSRSMLATMMTEISRGLRNVIPPKMKSVKKSIGRRNKRSKKTGEHEAKVGFGVGKKKNSTKQRDPKKGGVGIGVANVHWIVLGTDQRFTKAGANRGRIRMKDWMKRAFAGSSGKAREKAIAKGRERIEKEARKA